MPPSPPVCKPPTFTLLIQRLLRCVRFVRTGARNLAAGLMVGLILGITLAFVQEALDTSVRTTEEAERLVNAPALAVIPAEADGYRRKQWRGAVLQARRDRMAWDWRF